ncbi:MAG TPA: DinB family protein [Hanamia sp.]|nr:DinB family protein [Hanamia sp.]
MQVHDFDKTIDIWIASLNGCTNKQLLFKVSHGWSYGQLINHLIENTEFCLSNANICISGNENADEKRSPSAENIFANNQLPNIDIKGPASNDSTPQPDDVESLKRKMTALKLEMNSLLEKILSTQFSGKTQHPGLGFFDASEWLQFAQIHLRHHFKHKDKFELARIESGY